MSAWQSYLEQAFLQVKGIVHGAILSPNEGYPWAISPGFTVSYMSYNAIDTPFNMLRGRFPQRKAKSSLMRSKILQELFSAQVSV
jgi:hypothetical protein